jgi:hypothetical protein
MRRLNPGLISLFCPLPLLLVALLTVMGLDLRNKLSIFILLPVVGVTLAAFAFSQRRRSYFLPLAGFALNFLALFFSFAFGSWFLWTD